MGGPQKRLSALFSDYAEPTTFDIEFWMKRVQEEREGKSIK